MSIGQFSIGEIKTGELPAAEAGTIAVQGASGRFQLYLMPQDLKSGSKKKAPGDNWTISK